MFSGTGVALHFASIAPLTMSRTVTIRTIGLTLLAFFAGVTTIRLLTLQRTHEADRGVQWRVLVPRTKATLAA
jgi:hypothetical protein